MVHCTNRTNFLEASVDLRGSGVLTAEKKRQEQRRREECSSRKMLSPARECFLQSVTNVVMEKEKTWIIRLVAFF